MKYAKFYSILLLFAVFFTFFSGCRAPVNIAIVWGYHNNAPKPDYRAKQVEDDIHQVLTCYGTIAIVVNDGDPFVVTNLKNKSPGDPKNEVAIKNEFSSVKAKSPEVNTLAAIDLAARCLANQDGVKHLYILDSGLSTAGPLNFQDGWLQQGSDAAVSYLQEQQALPKLDGIEKVVWIGLGDVAGEQEKLSPKDRETLKEIWNRILRQAGAEVVDFAPDPPGNLPEDYEDLPKVTPVNLEPVPPPTTELPEPTKLPPIDRIKISFVSEEAIFLDPDDARQKLLPIAEALQNTPECRIVLAGMTATGESKSDCQVLSQDRAEAVRSLLLELGVAESQIAGVKGLGYDNDYHIPDVVDGNLVESLAEQNRIVLVLDATLAEAQEVLNNSQP